MAVDQGVCARAVAEDRAEERVMTMVGEGADGVGIGLGHRPHVSWPRSGMPCQRHGARAVPNLAAQSGRRNPEAAPFRRCGQRSVNRACTASGRVPHEHPTGGRARVGRNLRNSVPEMTRETTQRRRPPGSRAAPGTEWRRCDANRDMAGTRRRRSPNRQYNEVERLVPA